MNRLFRLHSIVILFFITHVRSSNLSFIMMFVNMKILNKMIENYPMSKDLPNRVEIVFFYIFFETILLSYGQFCKGYLDIRKKKKKKHT